MENYLRIFDTDADYEFAKSGLKYPTVSYVKKTDVVYYMDKPKLSYWVDLGLPSGLKWAAWNLGATKPEEFGLYFQWGETQGHTGPTDTERFWWDDYTFYDVEQDSMTKYNETDGLTTLGASDDAAIAADSSCRMPTAYEYLELIDNTTSEWVDDYNGTGVAGRILTSNVNGNSIFIPAAGCCRSDDVENAVEWGGLWSSSIITNDVRRAGLLALSSRYVDVDTGYRRDGLPVRAVKP